MTRSNEPHISSNGSSPGVPEPSSTVICTFPAWNVPPLDALVQADGTPYPIILIYDERAINLTVIATQNLPKAWQQHALRERSRTRAGGIFDLCYHSPTSESVIPSIDGDRMVGSPDELRKRLEDQRPSAHEARTVSTIVAFSPLHDALFAPVAQVKGISTSPGRSAREPAAIAWIQRCLAEAGRAGRDRRDEKSTHQVIVGIVTGKFIEARQIMDLVSEPRGIRSAGPDPAAPRRRAR